jgi:hypothetical protein
MRIIQSRNLIRARHPASVGKKKYIRVLRGKPAEMRPLERCGHR